MKEKNRNVLLNLNFISEYFIFQELYNRTTIRNKDMQFWKCDKPNCIPSRLLLLRRIRKTITAIADPMDGLGERGFGTFNFIFLKKIFHKLILYNLFRESLLRNQMCGRLQ